MNELGEGFKAVVTGLVIFACVVTAIVVGAVVMAVAVLTDLFQ